MTPRETDEAVQASLFKADDIDLEGRVVAAFGTTCACCQRVIGRASGAIRADHGLGRVTGGCRVSNNGTDRNRGRIALVTFIALGSGGAGWPSGALQSGGALWSRGTLRSGGALRSRGALRPDGALRSGWTLLAFEAC